jgi:hypothetical protein
MQSSTSRYALTDQQSGEPIAGLDATHIVDNNIKVSSPRLGSRALTHVWAVSKHDNDEIQTNKIDICCGCTMLCVCTSLAFSVLWITVSTTPYLAESWTRVAECSLQVVALSLLVGVCLVYYRIFFPTLSSFISEWVQSRAASMNVKWLISTQRLLLHGLGIHPT